MNIQQDFKELLQFLSNKQVRYIIVGGYAVAFHGFPRLTKDIDIYYDIDHENVQNIIDALVSFGFSRDDLAYETFTTIGNIITFGVEPVRVDFINKISGVDFKDAWGKKVPGLYGDVDVNFIGFDDLIKNKLSTDRPKDKLDVDELTSQ